MLETHGFEVLPRLVPMADIERLRLVVDGIPPDKLHPYARWIRLCDTTADVSQIAKRFSGRLRKDLSLLKNISAEHYETAKIGWHRDADAAGTAGLRCITVWIPLDVGPMLQFVPGSHKVMRRIPTRLQKTGEYETISDDLITSVFTPSLSLGDAIVFDENTLHRTEPSPGGRRSAEIRIQQRSLLIGVMGKLAAKF